MVNAEFARCLFQASVAVHEASRSPGAVFRSFEEQLRNFDLAGAIGVLDGEQARISIRAATLPRYFQEAGYSDSLVKVVQDYEFKISKVAACRKALESGTPCFVENALVLIQQAGTKGRKGKPALSLDLFQNFPAILAPLVMDGRIAGLVAVGAAALTPDDVPTVEIFCAHVSAALEQSRVLEAAFAERNQIEATLQRNFEAEHRARERSEALRDATRSLGFTLSLEDVLRTILDQLAPIVPHDSGCVILAEADRLRIRSWCGYDRFVDASLVPKVSFDPETDETCGAVVRSGKSIMLPEAPSDPRWKANRISGHIQSWLGVPLQVRDQVIGLISLDRISPQGFDDEEIFLVQSFALHASAAIENARLFEAEEQRATELLAVRQATLSLTSSLETGAVLNSILESTLRFLPGTQSAHIYLYQTEEQEEEHLSFGAALWKDKRQGEALVDLPAGDLTYTVAHTGQPLFVADTSRRIDAGSLPPGSRENGSLVSLPLRMGQRVVGVMNVWYPYPRTFLEAELRVLSLLGDQAAIAIENSRLYRRVEVERSHLGLLYDLGQELTTRLNYDEILDRATTLTCQVLGGLVGEAFLYEPEQNRLRLRAFYGRQVASLEDVDKLLMLTPGKGLVGKVAKNRQPLNVADVHHEPEWLYVPTLHEGVTSGIFAPILDGERLLGVLVVLHRQPAAFSRDHLDLLQAIALQVALALTNAERYQQIQSLVDMLALEQFRLESLVERLPVGVLLLDENYEVLIANLQARQIVQSVNGQPAEGKLRHLGSYSLDDLTLRPSAEPREIITEGKERTIVEVESRPIGAEAHQWVITLRNVTQERENQERIRMQERLATVGQLAAGIAHDFNNIMAAIMVYSDLLMTDTQLSKNSRDRLGVIQQQVQRAASLIHQILDFSRRSVMEQSPMDLLPFLKELNKLLSRVLPETIHLESEFKPGTYFINADPTRLQQVFMNLVLNARDAMPDGGNLRFSMNRFELKPGEYPPHPELTPGEWVRVTVEDTGTGIEADIMPRIFDPFFTTKPVGQGTGLGLSQVYGIVKQHGGFIDVISKVGQGTRFLIYLPALKLLREDENQNGGLLELSGRGITVLVVEDDLTTQQAVRDLLEVYSFRVLTASNGLEALRIFDREGSEIVLVVTDIVMPKMGGVALFQYLREQWPKVKILFVTGHPLDSSNQDVLEKGRVQWLQKPFSVQEFGKAVRDLLF